MKNKTFLRKYWCVLSFVVLICSSNSCQKADINQAVTSMPEESSLEKTAHILAFKEKMEYYRDHPGVKSGGESYFAHEAVEELESLLNLEFSHTSLCCIEKTFAITTISMPLDSLEKIWDPQLMLVYYDDIIESIQSQMNGLDYPDKKLLLVDLEYTGNDSIGDAMVSIGSLIGNPVPIILHNNDWWYGEQLGLYPSGQLSPEDAATQLMQRVIDQVLPDPPSGGRWFYTSIEHTKIDPLTGPLHGGSPDNYRDFEVFYASEAVLPITNDEKHLPMAEMDFYEDHYIAYALDYEIATAKDFSNCQIDGNPYYFPTHFIQHDYELFVGFRHLIMETSINNILLY